VVLLNAAPGIVCAGKARTLVEGIRVAEQSIDTGQAMRVLEGVARLSQES
jgi:anthranilate phosphoribosyltransferase